MQYPGALPLFLGIYSVRTRRVPVRECPGKDERPPFFDASACSRSSLLGRPNGASALGPAGRPIDGNPEPLLRWKEVGNRPQPTDEVL